MLRLPAWLAEKLAGRLNFTIGLAADRVGLAFIRSFYMHANDPLPYVAISPLAEQSLQWCVAYLTLRPTMRAQALPSARLPLVMWSDAEGPTRRNTVFLW